MRQSTELALLLVVAGLGFLPGLGRYRYIKTESLRAVVVAEMLPRDGLTMPTTHETPYLKKPPLYAWTTTLLARGLGRFDEFVARLPSAACGILWVVLMYGLGEWWVGRGAGLAAAVLTLLAPTISDYAVRAELDLPFGLFCTAAIASALTAMKRSTPSPLLWCAAYAAALVASMWKGPHALIFMWLAMLAYARWTGRWSFLRSGAHWVGCAAVLAVLVYWTTALGDFAGGHRVGRTAGVELFIRLVPHNVSNFVSILTFPIVFIVVTFPASVFALTTLDTDVRRACGWPEGQPGEPRGWWTACTQWWGAIRGDRTGLLLASWAGYNFLFMAIAPGKAPRYTIPLFAPVILLGALAMWRCASPGTSPTARRRMDRVWIGLFAVIAILGAAALVAGVAALAGWTTRLGTAHLSWCWWVMGLGWLAPVVIRRWVARSRNLRGRLFLLLCVFLTFQPVLKLVWWPEREAADSPAAAVAQLDAQLPGVEPIFVLGKREYPDLQIYSHRRLVFARSIDDALERGGGAVVYCVARTRELEKLTRDAAAVYDVVFHFTRAGHDNVVIRVTPVGGGQARVVPVVRWLHRGMIRAGSEGRGHG